jgi:hypothetical protein
MVTTTMSMSDDQSIDPPGVWRVAADGWRISWRVWQTMPSLLASAIGCFVILAVLLSELSNNDPAHPLNLTATLTNLLDLVALAAIEASLAIAVHRMVLLNEIEDRLIWRAPPQFGPFFQWLLVMQCVQFIGAIGAATVPFEHFLLWGVALLALSLIQIYVVTRCMLLFPAIAIDAATQGLGSAWDQSRGRFWRFFGVCLCSSLMVAPVWLGIIVLYLIARQLLGYDWHQIFGGDDWFLNIMSAVIQPLWTVALAASASILYRNFASRLAR